ncbi:Vegetative incompatibility protein HET-E-1 [Colletotrichum fructicola]|nr:Vegetative incompatibility protein HET-E-1 [Colletotrichum fructicola]
MWLLDTQTLKLQEIVDPSTVNYAILSHTWEHDEVSFQDISDLDSARKKAGFSKISKTCELARQRSIPYAWVDTCCIDKSSSAELSEAINSMFQWYKLSVVCFVYLSDFTFDVPFSSFTTYTVEEKALCSSRWFTRGWTLQELIAPSSVTFYNTRWKAKARTGAEVRDPWSPYGSRSHTNKVYFVDEESNDQLQDSEAKSARVTTFEISLETCSDFLFTEYYILVTGQVRIMDLATVLGTNQVRNLLALGVREWDPYLLDLHYHSDFSEESAFEASAVNSPSSPAAEGLSAECPLAPTET